MKFLLCAFFIIQLLFQSCGTWGNKHRQRRTGYRRALAAGCSSAECTRRRAVCRKSWHWRLCLPVCPTSLKRRLSFGLRPLSPPGARVPSLCPITTLVDAKEGSPHSLPVGKEISLVSGGFSSKYLVWASFLTSSLSVS